MKSALELRFSGTVKREGLLPSGSRVVAAVSGGADSVCLLMMLLRFRRHMSWKLTVLHVDHSFRRTSRADAAFVEELARGFDLPLILRRLPARTGKDSPEAEFSSARQAIYEEAAEAEGGLVAVGHTASDRAETLLMRLTEGSGLRGLGGMDYFGIGPVRRPLLDLTASETREYLITRGQAWTEDETNSGRDYARNRIRHDILEPLEAGFPGVSRRIAASSANLGSWRRVAEGLTSSAMGLIRTDDGEVLDRNAYSRFEKALRLSILWEECGRPRSGGVELDKTDSWILAGGSGERLLPGGVVLSAGEATLSFGRREGGRYG